MTAEQLFNEVKEFFPFISGITTSGGECGLYIDFLEEFYTMVKEAGKTTYMDTNGQIPLWDKPDFLKVMDKAMIDLKAGSKEEHEKLTGMGLDTPVDNGRTVELGSALIAPYPQVRYKLIKFRRYGVRENFSKTPEPDDKMMEELRQRAMALGIKEVIIT